MGYLVDHYMLEIVKVTLKMSHGGTGSFADEVGRVKWEWSIFSQVMVIYNILL